MSWSLAQPDTPRFLLPDNELLIEGEGTNLLTRALAEGAVPGSPGSLPTNWTQPVTQGAMSRTVSNETAAGVSGVGIGLSGSPSNGNPSSFETIPRNLAPAAAPNEALLALAMLWLAGGSLNNIDFVRLRVVGLTAAGSIVPSATLQGADLKAQLSGTPRLFVLPVTLPDDPTIARATWGLEIRAQTGVFSNVILGVAWVGLFGGAVRHSPVLPPAGTPQQSTVGRDVLSLRLDDVLVPPSGACTLLLSGRLLQAAPAGVTQMLAQIDDGTDANRVLVYCAPGTASLRMRAVVAGVAGPEVTLGTVVPGQVWRLVASLDGAGRVGASLDNAPAVAVSGGPVANLAWALFGSSRAGDALFGTLRHIQVIPAVTPDAALPALAALMP